MNTAESQVLWVALPISKTVSGVLCPYPRRVEVRSTTQGSQIGCYPFAYLVYFKIIIIQQSTSSDEPGMIQLKSDVVVSDNLPPPPPP